MLEGLTPLGLEDYIWAMRVNAAREDEFHLEHDSSSVRAAITKKKLEEPVEEYQAKVMASLVPDEVIYNVDDYKHRHYEACFLFGDVSGFTELCEKYTKTGSSGPSRMTQVLNKYLGSMVQEVISHYGDVLKFSGDAFLAVFKSTESQSMRDAVHEALDCALVIQKNYGSYLTDVGVVIRVKLAISAGLVTFALIGNEKSSHYVVVGKPIWDVKAAESISVAGDIIIAPAAWRYVNATEYLYQEMNDNVHIKITGVGPNWRSVQKSARQQTTHQMYESQSIDDDESVDSDVISDITQEGGNDEFLLRPSVNTAIKLNIKENLRKFIIAPVMKSIEHDEPFEYLTEMRQAVICVINVVSSKLKNEQTVILADQTYKTVCRVVDGMNGCVNKVSLFDKDLMFVVIFGLRGLKHELECQVALRCARECHEAISKLPGVLSASIGVTTGKTYCGVFGHTLRREYTVISLVVNKAARLMVAYKGKVTCDRETFLHSKLEARHFILQEYKPLKGISKPGPVYEFKEVDIDHNEIRKINARPLLGKTEKLTMYRRLIEKWRKHSESSKIIKMFILKGEARIGKTRLLEELVFITPDEIFIDRFTLSRNDQTIPYQTTRLIFNPPLFLAADSHKTIKQMKLKQMLEDCPDVDLICVLNNIFNVRFTPSEKFNKMTRPERQKALLRIIKYLAYACYSSEWVLAIDNCEYIDKQSWVIVKTLLDVKTLFIIGTLAREEFNRTELIPKEISTDPRVKCVFMKPIERWYLGALACHILGVYAISPELENAVQTKSNGNPGWVESFLITSIQDRALVILKATLHQINSLGLVCPPLYMMARLTPEETTKWQNVMEEKKLMKDVSDFSDNWHKYVDTCRDSYLNVSVREQMEAMEDIGRIPICVISPKFTIADEQMELSLDTAILRTFDSLTFFEQFIVKCSAVLGYQFWRDMLLYVASSTNDKRKAALAIKQLFEIGVFCCAKGDFLEDGQTIFKEQLKDPTVDTKPTCKCKGIKVEILCMDLPKYASCGYIQFRSGLFRELTYSLLTEDQKKDFHRKAVRYLERETRKCKACGNTYFDRIFKAHQDKELTSVRNRYRRESRDSGFWAEALSASRRSSKDSSSMYSASYRQISLSSSAKKVKPDKFWNLPSHIFVETIEDRFADRSTFGITIINKLKDSFSLTRAFSSEDFTDCRCNLILSMTYAQLIKHYTGAGDSSKAVEAMLAYSKICINLSNTAQAFKTLDEALEVVKRKRSEPMENPWKLALVRAKIYILTAYAHLERYHYEEAEENLHLALNEYEIKFPKGASRSFKKYVYQFKHFFGLYVFPRTLMKRLNHWESIYANDLSQCLSYLCQVFMLKQDWKNAELAAAWSLTKSLQSFSNFCFICQAFAIMIDVAEHFQKYSLSLALEVNSLRLCHYKKEGLENEELKMVVVLYASVFRARIRRLAIDKTIQIGYISMRLAISTHACRPIISVVPLLVYALMMEQHFSNVYNVLQEFDMIPQEDIGDTAKLWYHAICLGILLDTGYTIVPYQTCENFFQYEGESWISVRQSEAKIRFYVVMWLWCIRNEKWEAAAVWSLKSENFMTFSFNDSLSNAISALYLLEGLLLCFVSKLDKHSVVSVIQIEQQIKQLFKKLEKATKINQIILPRLYHMKAYYVYIKKDYGTASDLLDKALKFTYKQHNTLEKEWILHSTKAWLKQLSAAEIDYWKEHSDYDTWLDFRDIENAENGMGYFTLPTPFYLH